MTEWLWPQIGLGSCRGTEKPRIRHLVPYPQKTFVTKCLMAKISAYFFYIRAKTFSVFFNRAQRQLKPILFFSGGVCRIRICKCLMRLLVHRREPGPNNICFRWFHEMFWKNLEAHCFDCFVGESVRKKRIQGASRLFQNSGENYYSTTVKSVLWSQSFVGGSQPL